MIKSIAVFCGSSLGNAPIFEKIARQLGKMLAEKQITLVYGGGRLGLMGAVADGVMEHGGQVIGVIPRFLSTKEVAHVGITELISVETMHERKLKMSDLCEGVIVLPGGFGTLDELAEMLTWAQLGLHQKPIGILNIEGYYDPLDQLFRTMETNGLLKTYNRKIALFANNLEELFTLMENYRPVPVKKWLKDKEKT
jgi:uncharacterized protein (TIGR00730 family)